MKDSFMAKVIVKDAGVRAGAVVELSPVGLDMFRVMQIDGETPSFPTFLYKGDFDFVEGDHGIKEEV